MAGGDSRLRGILAAACANPSRPLLQGLTSGLPYIRQQSEGALTDGTPIDRINLVS